MSARILKIPFRAVVWLYEGVGGWHFVTLGKHVSQKIKSFVDGDTSAWGSIKVTVIVKDYEWKTSLFPDRKRASYLLPIKKGARKALTITEGSSMRGFLVVVREGIFFEP